jgi:hypothetical protein
MYSTLKLGAVAMIAIVLAIAIDPFRPPTPYGAGDPSPSPTPAPIDMLSLPASWPLDAGTTYLMDWSRTFDLPPIVFTVPADGWIQYGSRSVSKGDRNPFIGVWSVRNLMADPCHAASKGELDPPLGPTADDLVNGLLEQAAGSASDPTAMTIGGYPATRLELSMPDGVTTAACDGAYFARWYELDIVGNKNVGGAMLTSGQRDVIYVLDVDGRRTLIQTTYLPGIAEETLAEAEQLVASMHFLPLAPVASPGASPAS